MTKHRGTLAQSDAGSDALSDWLQPFTEGLADEESEDEVFAFVDVGGNSEQELEPEILPPVRERRTRPNGSKPTSTRSVFQSFPGRPNL